MQFKDARYAYLHCQNKAYGRLANIRDDMRGEGKDVGAQQEKTEQKPHPQNSSFSEESVI